MTRRRDRRQSPQHGFSLVELMIVVVLLGLVTSGLTASFITALRGNDTAAQRIKESNDAQVVAAFLARDAQAAGGSDPASNTLDSTIGVSRSDDAGCSDATSTLVLRFKWKDYASNTAAPQTRVVGYFYKSSAGQITRRSCTNGSFADSTLLASYVSSSPAPAAACSPGCSGIPDTVSLTLTATNTPRNAPTPYTYTLTAATRAQAGVAPTGSTAGTVPLLLLGNGSGCPAGGGDASGISSQGGGSSTLRIVGGAYVNGYSSSCPAVDLQGSSDYIASGGTTVLSPGTCQGTTCATMTSPIPDPFANLPAPAGTCSGGSNPVPVGGQYPAGVYPQLLSVTATRTLAAGNFVFCNGLDVSGRLTGTNVMMYFYSGSLTVTGNLDVGAPASGTYANIVAFQRNGNTTDFAVCCSNNAVAAFRGIVYAPTANVNLHNGTITAQAIIARSISWDAGGNGSTTIGQVPPALSITGPSTITSPWTRGVSYPSTTITATGGAGAYAWSATGLPAGLTINASTGVISGTPTASCACTVTVTVSDAFNTTATRSYPLSVNAAVAITGPASLPSWTAGTAYSAVTVVTSGGTSPLSFSATGLPPGLTIGSTSGSITGTPTAPGTYSSIVVTASDSVGATTSRSYSMTVNSALTIAGPASLPNGQQGTVYPGATLTGSGGTGAVTWSQSGLPAGLGLNAGTGAISGTPTAVGTFTVTVTATDSVGATATRSFSITVTVVPFNVSSVALTNANGTVAPGDTVTIAFSKAINEATLCSTWSGAGNQSINGNNQVTVTITDGGAAGNDILTVTSTQCGASGFRFGSLDLGTPNVVSSTRIYAGSGGNRSSIGYTGATNQLVITLGGGTAGNAGVAPQTIVYTPNNQVADTFGNPFASATYSFATQRF